MLKKIVVNTGWQIAGKAVALGVSLVTTGLLTRKLGGEGYGGLVLISSMFVFLDSLADFGTKIIGTREAVKEKEVLKHLAGLRLLTTGVGFGVGLAIIWWWEGLAGLRPEATVGLLMMWLTSVAGSLEIGWQARMEMGKKVMVESLFPILFLIGLWRWGGEISLIGVFWGYLIAKGVSLTVGLMLEKIKFEFDWKKMIWLVKESWPMGVYLLVFSAYDRVVDSMMIERMMGIKEVGWYGLAYKIYSNLVQPAYFLVASVFPLLSAKTRDKRGIFWKTMRMLIMGATGIMLVIWWGAPAIINILAGSDFGPAVGVLRLLLIALFFAYIQHLVGFSLISQGKQKELLKVGLTVLVFNLTANWFSIPRWGIMGAAGVTGATEALGTLLMARELKKSLKG